MNHFTFEAVVVTEIAEQDPGMTGQHEQKRERVLR